MKKTLSLLLPLLLSGTANAVDAENRASNVLQFGKWVVIEFTLPEAITYRIGAESNLPQQQRNIFIDLFPGNQCQPGKITVNQFIGDNQLDLSGISFLPVKYKVNGQNTKESITKPEVSDGFIFTPIEAMEVTELLQTKDKGYFTFWIQPPAKSTLPVQKMFFPMDGFSKAYNKAAELCKQSM